MKRFVLSILILGTFSSYAFAQRSADRPTRIVRYKKVTSSQIKANYQKTMELAETAKKLLKTDLKLVKSKHFLIFSTRSDEENEAIKKTAEKMYKALCNQYGVSIRENVWAGKCPIYVFDKKEEYIGFTTKVDKTNHGKATGYCHYSSKSFCYIVMGPCNTEAQFYEVLVHEASHGFLGRSLAGKGVKIPKWVNEGLAEYMAAEIVPKSMAATKRVNAEKEVVNKGADGSKVFNAVSLASFDYGVSQSLVRFMIARSRKKFARFLKLIKEGESEKSTLKKAYGWTHEELYAAWLKEIKEPPAQKDKNAEEVVKYQKVTPEQIEANRKQAMDYAEAARKRLRINLRLVETKHFLLFSPWSAKSNKPLERTVEKMYKALSKQFDIPVKENVWAGKCPIYIFDKQKDYVGFTTKIDKAGADKAAGYCRSSTSGFCYVVMGPCKTKTRFYEVLVHEATHGFVGRYLTNRFIPTWVNEGLADYMAATLVPKCSAARKYIAATKNVATKGTDGSRVFEDVGLNSFDYGVSQSLVRFMASRDHKGFIKFIKLIKQDGKTEEDALQEAYGWTHKELYAAWLKVIKKKYRRHR